MAFHNIPPNGFPDIPDMEELEAVVKDVNNLKTSVAGLATDVSNLSDNKANQITIAPFFDPETSYEVGDLVYYNGLNYRCTNDHEGEWDADDFAATTVAGELATLKSGLTNVISNVVFEPEQAPGTDPFNTNGSGYVMKIKYQGTLLGYLVIRPKGYVTDQGVHNAFELYNAEWSPMWYVEYHVTN